MKPFFFYQDHFLRKINNTFILVECKEGFTCNGKLKKFDAQLNMFMENSVLTFRNGVFFKEIKHLFLKGNTVKYIRII
jgi:small nuclear ribonucleoprotein (snRNP)-like protein